jgi:lipid II isoglutaminyl synthase (glutamine-hydrolysing)
VDLPARTRLAVAAGRAVSEVSRRVGAGQGSAVGGRVTLALDPEALAQLAAGRRIGVVSGTNGKTTTTRLLAAALGTKGPVATNSAGANLLSGLVGTFSVATNDTELAALEVDEGLVPRTIEAVHPAVVALLNLSRDQLDRIGEVRLHAQKWRHALAGAPETAVVANADDPLVAWAAEGASDVTWVATGQRWRSDAAACPVCGSRLRWSAPKAGGSAWSCTGCDFARAEPHLVLDGDDLVLGDGRRVPIRLQLPGWCNRANAAMAAAAASVLGVGVDDAIAAMADVGTVAGRYEVVDVDGVSVRLLLAKNPAGWAETLDLIRPAPLPVIVGINARVADGRDPSWLWDVPFERLAGRLVIATGDRGRDLAVRLRYAGVDHRFVDDYRRAVQAAGDGQVDLAANYTSFQDARKALARRG